MSNILEEIKKMSVKELADLVKSIEDEFGVSAAPVAMAGNAGAAAQEEEKSEFTPVLKSFGEKKIDVIRIIRSITGLGLKEAKDFVEAGNKPIREAVSKEEAETIKKQLEDVGATVEIT